MEGVAVKRERIAKGKPAEVDLVLAVQLWRRGEDMEAIGEAVGVTAKRAARVLRAAGHFVPYGKRKPVHLAGKRGPQRRLSEEQTAALVRMRDDEGMPFSAIGLAFDVSRQRACFLYQRAKGITPKAKPKDDDE